MKEVVAVVAVAVAVVAKVKFFIMYKKTFLLISMLKIGLNG